MSSKRRHSAPLYSVPLNERVQPEHAAVLVNSFISPSENHTNFGDLPSGILGHITRSMTDVKDIARFSTVNRHVQTLLPPDIRILYGKYYPTVRKYSPVKLYLFCLDRLDALVPRYFTTLKACFLAVDQLEMTISGSEVRVQVLHHFMNLAVSHENAAGYAFFFLLNLFEGTDWTTSQRASLLYQCPSFYFTHLWQKLCERSVSSMSNQLLDSHVPNECKYSLLFHNGQEMAFLPPLAQDLTILQWNMLVLEFINLNHVLCEYPVFSHQETHDWYHQNVTAALDRGANIHNTCLKDYLYTHISRKPVIVPSVDYGQQDMILDLVMLKPRNWRSFPKVEGFSSFLAKLVQRGLWVGHVSVYTLPLLYITEDYDCMRVLLDAGASMNKAYASNTEVPLIEAAYAGLAANVGLLLAYGANPNVSVHSMTPILLAESVEIVRLLVEYKADITAKDDVGQTALFYASHRGSLPLVQYWVLEQGFPAFQLSVSRSTPLQSCQSVRVAEFLLDQDPSQINHQNVLGITALMHNVIISSDFSFVAACLIERGANANLQDYGGRTALMMAPSVENTLLLLERGGADPMLVDVNGNTALMIAAFWLRLDIVRVMLRFGSVLGHRNNQGMNAYHMVMTREISVASLELAHYLQQMDRLDVD